MPVNVAGFPPGFNPRPSESNAAPDTSGSPTAPRDTTAGGRGGRGGGGGGGGRGNLDTADTSDYRVVLEIGGQRQMVPLRVLRVTPGQVAVMVGGAP